MLPTASARRFGKIEYRSVALPRFDIQFSQPLFMVRNRRYLTHRIAKEVWKKMDIKAGRSPALISIFF
jgi:hypothetical protein